MSLCMQYKIKHGGEQMDAIKLIDKPVWRKGRYVFTQDQLGVPGLRMFGKHQNWQALAALPLHYHENAYEMTYLTKGSLRFSIEGQMYHMTGGDLLIVRPDARHDTGAHPLTTHAMYWFQLDPTQEPFLFLEKETARRLIARLDGLGQGIIRLDETRVQHLLGEIFACFCRGDAASVDMGVALLTYFLHLAADCAEKTRFPLEPDIGRAAMYVLEHIEEEMTLEQLAAVAQLSISRFKEKFKRQMGLTPREYINTQRISAACEALREGKSVTQTAMELGFSSSNYFAVVFRRHMGLSPSGYQVQMKNDEQDLT